MESRGPRGLTRWEFDNNKSDERERGVGVERERKREKLERRNIERRR
jgi:hypothetical protein